MAVLRQPELPVGQLDPRPFRLSGDGALGWYIPLEFPLPLVCELGLRGASGALVLDPFLTVLLLALRTRDLVLPALAGMGRTKTWWSVLPIDRVCGGNYQLPRQYAFVHGLSRRGDAPD